MSDAPAKERLDKWLFHARFFKTRTLAAKVANGGHVRVNSAKVSKASRGIAVGAVLTFPQGRDIRVVRVEGFAGSVAYRADQVAGLAVDE